MPCSETAAPAASRSSDGKRTSMRTCKRVRRETGAKPCDRTSASTLLQELGAAPARRRAFPPRGACMPDSSTATPASRTPRPPMRACATGGVAVEAHRFQFARDPPDADDLALLRIANGRIEAAGTLAGDDRIPDRDATRTNRATGGRRMAVRQAARPARRRGSARNDCEDARSTGRRRATPRSESCRGSARGHSAR